MIGYVSRAKQALLASVNKDACAEAGRAREGWHVGTNYF